MNSAWRKEIAAAATGFVLAAVIGVWLGCTLAALLAASLTYLVWHLANAVLLYRRLRGATVARTPRAWGLWGDIQRELQRLEQTRRDFVGNASHELRTPLTVLRGYLDMINEEAATNDALQIWRNPLGDMLQQSARMEDIVNDMLMLARLESESASADGERVEVASLLDRIVHQAESLSGGRQRIRLNASPILHLSGQANELQSVFSNLIMNAVQHTPPGSEIVVRWKPQGQGARFSVSDDGPGIPAADIPRLTERFYRVDVGRSRASGGTGLGLAIVKHALERHESSLEIASVAGAGATFSCIFPPRRVIGSDRRQA
ncbi:MAG: phosphate regulon sensor protein PhoR [Gammaproteobacteria bacterium]